MLLIQKGAAGFGLSPDPARSREGARRRLTDCLRSGDIVARYGGDEFVVLCAQATPEVAITGISARIRQVFAAPFDLAGEALIVGMSVGAVSAAPGMDAAALLEQADAAMYLAKRNRDRSTAVSLHVA